ncbi:alpha/beta hydrolase [Blastococcus sp. Marseille-P5729]|uniref:alpha/beta hydrolase n=1 Tax=Blastococcus sp. Marseille-P5729 TaxID=2086582 RepID=UPI000D0EBC51|nr:alpha/beta hydrolase [Blastococcus sp. Marseille-P5729]
MPLDDASQQLIAAFIEAGRPPIWEGTPDDARAGHAAMGPMSGPGPEVHDAREERISTYDGDEVRLKILTPSEQPRGIVLYIHGGGFVIGDIDHQYDAVGRDLATRTDCTVVLVNYRKAPENPFPKGIEDCWSALQWVDARRGELARAGAKLFIAGDSAGGNLAAVMTHRALDRGGPHLDGQVLVYPATDNDFGRPEYSAPENQLLLSMPAMEWFHQQYLPDERDRGTVEAAPLRRLDFTGLPPAYVLLAEYDPLIAEGRDYADALAAAGVPVETSVAEGQMHIFFQMYKMLPGYEVGMSRVSDWLNSQLG